MALGEAMRSPFSVLILAGLGAFMALVLAGGDRNGAERSKRHAPGIVAAAILHSAAQAQELPLNPAVTPATIGETICVYGWTASVRPSYGMTNRIKSELLRKAGLTDAVKSRFELDHIIPLSLGGAPADPRNLQLQPWSEATEKDRVEACLPRLVCEGRLGLEEARRAIWSNWREAEKLCRR